MSKSTHKSLKRLAKAWGETQKATLEKLIEEGFQNEANKEEAIKQATQQAEELMADKQSPTTWPLLDLATTTDLEALKELLSQKNKEIQHLKETITNLTQSQNRDLKDLRPGQAPHPHMDRPEDTNSMMGAPKSSGIAAALRQNDSEEH